MNPTETIATRILDAVPARAYEMQALLGLVRIEVSDAVPTAAVTCAHRPVLHVNPDFVARHCDTDEHLFLLVMHELHHVLLGHTRLFRTPTPAHNLAFDAVINAWLCARFPAPAYTSFFLELYGKATDAVRLLAPPGDPPLEGELGALHTTLYGEDTVSAREVFDALVRHVSDFTLDPSLPLLGSHGDDAEAVGQAVDGQLVEALRGAARKWPAQPGDSWARGLSDFMRPCQLDPAERLNRDVLIAVRRALLGAASFTAQVAKRTYGPVPAVLPIPSPRDRRAHVLRATGTTPLLYAQHLRAPRGWDRSATHVYLDVSGSMTGYLPALVRALAVNRELVAPRVHLFSTKVATVPLAQVTRGHLDSTLGTDITCVFEHVAQLQPRRALIVTDGMVGRASNPLLQRVRQAGTELRVLLTPSGQRCELQGIVHRFYELPVIHGGGR